MPPRTRLILERPALVLHLPSVPRALIPNSLERWLAECVDPSTYRIVIIGTILSEEIVAILGRIFCLLEPGVVFIVAGGSEPVLRGPSGT